MAVVATCHCGAVTLTVDTPPTEITECNCSICRRYGALWAYYPKGAVTFVPPEAATDTYLWDDRSIGLTAAASAAASPTGGRLPSGATTAWASMSG